MAKLKKPLLSLDARGTVADTLTFQKRQGTDLVKKKPVPSQPKTLRQMYQRWQYQDYVAYWHTLPQSTKDFYRSQGSRCHLPGFAYFMRVHLVKLPDLVARFHLDETEGATAYDTSIHNNHATIVGASPVDAVIAGGYHFNGVNNRILIPNPEPICPTSAISFTYFMRLTSDRAPGAGPNMQTCGKVWIFRHGWGPAQGHLSCFLLLDGVDTGLGTIKNTWNGGQWYHIAHTFDGSLLSVYVDGLLNNTKVYAGSIDTNGNPAELGSVNNLYWFAGDIDEWTEHNRCLTASDVLRLSGRRYPL